MLLISNRGNINGPNSLLENTPDYIDSTIDQGYNVKIDLWYIHDKCFFNFHFYRMFLYDQLSLCLLTFGPNV